MNKKYEYYRDTFGVRDTRNGYVMQTFEGYIHKIADGVLIGLYKKVPSASCYNVVEVKTGLGIGSDVAYSTIQGTIDLAHKKYEQIGHEKFIECINQWLNGERAKLP